MAPTAASSVPASSVAKSGSVTKSGARPAPVRTRADWLAAFRRVRGETEARASHLSAEDQIVQSMADASPAKWHRAHVTWFF